jgi:23S rRNA (uracil1939-C5)-methyltransferase
MNEQSRTPWPSSDGPPLEVEIESLAQGGAGVSHWEGRPVFVNGALPGERVQARLVERRDGWARGELVALLGDPAPERIVPPCPVFATCGGCDWQHHTIDSQRAAKQTILAEQHEHVGRLAGLNVMETAGAAAWRYRTTARFHIDGETIGFYAAGGRQVVDLAECPLLDDRLNAALGHVRALLPLVGLQDLVLRLSTSTGQIHAHIEGRGAAEWRPWARSLKAADPAISGVSSATRSGWLMLAGTPWISEMIGGVELRISPTSFFQANVERARAVLAVLENWLELRPDTSLLDAFCGVGTFLLPLAQRVGEAVGMEAHQAAITDAEFSAKALGLTNTTLHVGAVEDSLAKLNRRFDCVILDPPRRGLEAAAVKALLRNKPRQIAYVSCHPGTLARDVRAFTAAGYTVEQAQPFDFFPQSSHIESLVLLRLAEPAA